MYGILYCLLKEFIFLENPLGQEYDLKSHVSTCEKNFNQGIQTYQILAIPCFENVLSLALGVSSEHHIISVKFSRQTSLRLPKLKKKESHSYAVHSWQRQRAIVECSAIARKRHMGSTNLGEPIKCAVCSGISTLSTKIFLSSRAAPRISKTLKWMLGILEALQTPRSGLGTSF
jgi:hypothetical protein